jgi:hypothetical protein
MSLGCLAPSKAVAALQRSSVAGAVEDSLGTPLADVQVSLVGSRRSAATDAKGIFRLGDLEPGQYLLRFRRLGFEALLLPIQLPLADASPLAIELRTSVTELAPVLVKSSGVSARLLAFGFANRKQFSGAPAEQFITRTELDQLRPIDLTQMLRRMSGRAGRCGDGVVFLDGVLLTKPIADPLPSALPGTNSQMYSSNPAVAGAAARRAVQEVAKTGVATPKPMPLDLVPVNWIEGMEVYASPAQIPNEYRAAFREARCVILLWTR